MGATAYGIQNGQVYVPADGSVRRLLVIDCDSYAACDDIVVRDMATNAEFRIDAFKLAMARYTLSEPRSNRAPSKASAAEALESTEAQERSRRRMRAPNKGSVSRVW
jgi:hypothetical protein